jgi:hypothetical protein
VRLLCEKFGIALPEEYRRFVDEENKGKKR